ncbi:MAG TPA: TIGR03086 family metal-binding protein [Pseudonocardiaceae bacterium]|nr:TIGR03086 family metal-binding protein [Pseudonocardiaceae bacterium]
MDIVVQDARALASAERSVAHVTEDRLAAPTPCAEWTLRELLVHMTGNNKGFADAAEGKPADGVVWAGGAVGDDLLGEYVKSSERVRAAFAAPGVLERRFDVHGFGSYPAVVAIGMHFVDYLTHGWDVARAVGAPDELDADLCDAVLEMGRRWPAGSWGPGAPFAERVAVAADASAQDRMLGFLGRSPRWPV